MRIKKPRKKFKKMFEDEFHHEFEEKFEDEIKDDHEEAFHHHDKHEEDEDCVCSIVKKIHKAQSAVKESDCRVSCETSIQQLLSPAPKANTIPFTLTCDCDLFIAKAPVYSRKENFKLISSPFFRVKKVNHNCCAVLELLLPTKDGKTAEGVFKHDDHHSDHSDFDGFVGTGACITVDLHCFCNITCFKPTIVHTRHHFFNGHHD
ncbi:CotY/CotZ family spore coat protein [Calidifontibacillus erzurumensis]|uniref:Spore coat protein n=1 Tax=Calidifontibacillus erzurumensis TaxID=2741433 RepID=A0A8J8GD18_9BACI|nr:CotY/CotZ family spore coat protein [Calidifontibacillus erzurumensis]NSL51437.1 spore coat protein [Calidifontibacillus erzurumensis]